jgi:DNA invertase Pin-like site-specific DNA recombinase
VLHCCDNPPCCNPSHLFLGTRSENTHDRDAKGRTAEGLKHGRYTKPQSNAVGTRNGRAKITSEQAIEIARARKAGATLSSIAARFGIGKSQVYRIANGQSWTERTAY